MKTTAPLVIGVLLPVVATATALAQSLSPGVLAEGSAVAQSTGDCSDGVVLDDGTLETGYGWVPSVIDGRYVQRFERAAFRSAKIEEVCICWTRTRPDASIDFRVELYRDRGGRPAPHPSRWVDATATAVPSFPDGGFVSVDVSWVDMVATTDVFYLGVSWNPSADEFFFVCVDQSESTPVVDGWYIDDRATEWANVLTSPDPTFNDHRAMMIRARAVEGYSPRVPTAGVLGIVVLVLVVGTSGVVMLRRIWS